MRGGMNRGIVAALALAGAAAAGAGQAVGRMAEAIPDDLFVRRPGRDRANGGHRGKPHRDGKPAKRRNRLHVSRRVKRAHRKARRA
jgi:hypothetical protein